MSALRSAVFEASAPHVEAIWRALEPAVRPAYFLTWPWIETWLATLPAEATPGAVVLYDGADPVGAFFVGRHVVSRYGLFRGRGLFLNATGNPRFDALCAEYNGILLHPRTCVTLSDLVDALPGTWDELALPALDATGTPGALLGQPLRSHRVLVDETLASPFVDLGQVRAAAGGYLSLLGANTRAQIRRAERGFGALTVEQAADASQALDIYGDLVGLHQASWKRRGQPGAFSDPWFRAFHERLIRSRIAHGEIQLVRVRAGGVTIGCLYNLVSNGHVLFYQSGISEQSDPRLKAGYVCHAKAVEANAKAGNAVYDFLGAKTSYKESLATGARSLVSARIQRPLARFRVEEQLRRWKRALRAASPRGPRVPVQVPELVGETREAVRVNSMGDDG